MYIPNVACRFKVEMVISYVFILAETSFTAFWSYAQNGFYWITWSSLLCWIKCWQSILLVHDELCISYLPVLLMDPDWGDFHLLSNFLLAKLWLCDSDTCTTALIFVCEVSWCCCVCSCGYWWSIYCCSCVSLWTGSLAMTRCCLCECIFYDKMIIDAIWWLCILCPYRVDMFAVMTLLSCCDDPFDIYLLILLVMINFGVYLLTLDYARSNWSIPILFALLLLFCCLLLFLFEFAKPQSKWT